MENSKHCELCNLQDFNFNDGIICSLTKKKADFHKQCLSIDLGQKMNEKIMEINEEYEDLKYVKKNAISNLIFYSIIGIGVIYLSYFIGVKLLNKGVFSTVTILIFIVGLVVIGMGIGAMNFYLQKKKIIIPKKEDLDALTKNYKIDYEFKSEISTNIMGVKETKNQLRINGEVFELNRRN